jgi:nucleotide-binding universal stress UspA family protein
VASRGTFLLVAVDPDDPGDLLVIDEAASLARDLGVSVRLLTALPHEGSRSTKLLGLDDEDQIEAHKAARLAKLEALTEAFELNRVAVQCVVGVGDPAHVVLERARLARLVVLGTHGRGGLPRLLFGSVAEVVIRQSPTPVVVVRTHAET